MARVGQRELPDPARVPATEKTVPIENRIVDVWGERPPYARGGRCPVRGDAHLDDGVRNEAGERWEGRRRRPLHADGVVVAVGRDGAAWVGRQLEETDHLRVRPRLRWVRRAWRRRPCPIAPCFRVKGGVVVRGVGCTFSRP
jgi:hypothetical protein